MQNKNLLRSKCYLCLSPQQSSPGPSWGTVFLPLFAGSEMWSERKDLNSEALAHWRNQLVEIYALDALWWCICIIVLVCLVVVALQAQWRGRRPVKTSYSVWTGQVLLGQVHFGQDKDGPLSLGVHLANQVGYNAALCIHAAIWTERERSHVAIDETIVYR